MLSTMPPLSTTRCVIPNAIERGGSCRRYDERDPPDLQQFRRREEEHIALIMLNAVDDAALIDHEVCHPFLPGFNRARKARRSGSDYQKVICPGMAHNGKSCRAVSRQDLGDGETLRAEGRI